MQDRTVYVNGVTPDKIDNSLKSNIKDVLLKCTDNLAWLSPGDVVLLKPALNSPCPYPATTHPLSVHVISKILKDHGANVIVGDQSGIGYVVHHPGGVIRGNTKNNYIKSCMGTVNDKNFIGFEEEGWNEGFYHHISNKTTSWPNGFYITNWIQKADHIINLPRISSHSQAGATLGFKNMVGCLREDSRLEFHANGPYNVFIKNETKASSLESVDDKSGTFFEKIVEISDTTREKLRLTLFVATKAQATFGPDRQSLELGKLKIGKAHVVDLDPGLVFGSSDPVAAESFALALLKDIKKSVPFFQRLYEHLMLFSNINIAKMENIPVKDHPYISHAIKIDLGQIPRQINYNNIPDTFQSRLSEYL